MKCFSGGEIAAIVHGINELSDDLRKENEAVAQTLLCRYKAMHTCKFANAKTSIDLVGYLEGQYKAFKGVTFIEDVASLLMHKQLVESEDDQRKGWSHFW